MADEVVFTFKLEGLANRPPMDLPHLLPVCTNTR
jgi:hypothetical protein